MEDKLLKILDTYGIEHQTQKLGEEVIELIIEIAKYEENNLKPKGKILEELADVCVMIEQVKLYYNFDDKEMEAEKQYKINRQLERIEKGE